MSWVDTLLRAASAIPAVQIDQKHKVIDQRVRDRDLYARHHRRFLLAFGVLLPGPAVLGDHPDELLVAGHDCGHGGDQPGAEHEVAAASDVDERGRVAEPAGQEVWLVVGRGESVEDIKAPGEEVEGDREVHQSWMSWEAERVVSVMLVMLSGCVVYPELNSGTGSATLPENLL